MEFQRIDELAVALMMSAPIARCTCPMAAERDCSAARCWACYASLLDVVNWAHANVADVNGQWMSRQYLRRALLNDVAMWNIVRRGLMLRPEVQMRVEPDNAAAIAISRALANSISGNSAVIAMPLANSIVADTMVCTICFEVVAPGWQEHLPCMHAFHTECIGRWLRTQPTCPVCRAEF